MISAKHIFEYNFFITHLLCVIVLTQLGKLPKYVMNYLHMKTILKNYSSAINTERKFEFRPTVF